MIILVRKQYFKYSLLALLCVTCAHRQSPTGGPDDTTGPEVVVVSPPSESVNVSPSTSITLTFSEWLLPSSKKGIEIFPIVPIKTKVNGKRLEIKPLERLNDSTTYHLVITSALKDLRNNSMTKPISIIFSTGPSLDSGSISGCVVDPVKKMLQPKVVLFRAPWQADDSGFCGPPTYMVQTDSSGLFSFTHIRKSSYYLIAYFDNNNDSRLQNGSEEVYSPADSTITIGNAPLKKVLYPSTFDTSRQAISSVSAIDNRTIIGYWKRPWDSLSCPEQPAFALETADSFSQSLTVTYQQTPASTRFVLLPDTTLDSLPYRLIYTIKSILDTAAVTDTLRINGAAPPDTSCPFLTMSTPKTGAELHPEITLIWSEPVYFTDTLLLADTLGDTVLAIGDTSANDTSTFSISRSLLPGRVYRINLLTSFGKDFSGNPLKAKDSTDTAAIITISTIHADSIAVSLQGSALCLENTAQRKWTFQPLQKQKTFICSDDANRFRFDSLPATKGRIGTFIDFNNNDKPDIGRLIPFIAPEPFIMFDDTIEARARWDVEGIELGPCDPCERKPVEPSDNEDEKSEKAPSK